MNHTTHPHKFESAVLLLLISILSFSAFGQVNLPDGIHVLNPKPPDDRQHYSTRVLAWAGVASSRRYPGLTVFIDSANAEYWWRFGDLTNAGLVIKSSSGGLQQGNNELTDDLTLDGATNNKSLFLSGNEFNFSSTNSIAVNDIFEDVNSPANSSAAWTIGSNVVFIGKDGGTNKAGFAVYTGAYSGSPTNRFRIDSLGGWYVNGSVGSSGKVLTSNGAGTPPTWDTPSSGFADPLTTNGDIIARVSGSTTRLAKGSDGTFLGVSSGTLGYYTPSGGGGLTSITDDPFHYPANGNTNDQFGGRTSGNLKSIFNAYTLPVVTGLNNRLVIDGNSNGDGAALSDTTKRYGTVAAAILGNGTGGYTYKNFAVAGQTTVNMNTDAVSQIDGSYNSGKTKNYLAAFEVENDALLNPGSSTSTLYSNISSYWSGRKATGYYVIAMTSPLRGVYTTSQDLTINQRIETVNASIRSGTSDYNTLIDIPAIPRLSNFRSRIGFLNDNLHFNVSGQADLADRVVSKIRADQSQQDYTPPNFMSWNGNTPDRSMIAGSLNNQPFGFITNGKVRGEFESFGTFNINAHVVASDDILFNTKHQAIGMLVNAGLKADANDAIMSALTIQTEYFDPVSFTGTISDNFTINKQLTTTTHTNLLRIGANGEISHTAKLSGVSTSAISINPTIIGPSSGNYIENSISDSYTYNANNQSHTTVSISPNLTRGSFTNVAETTLDVNSGSTATTADKAINVSVAEGTGIAIGASGTGNGMNIISGSTGAGFLSLMTATAGIPAIMFKTNGTAVVQRNITNSTTSGILDMHSFERGATNQTTGSGLDNYFLLGSDASNFVKALQEDYYWLSNVDGSENAAFRWKAVVAGTLTEGMRLEGTKLIVAGSLNVGTMSTAGVLVNDASGNITSTTTPTFSLDNSLIKINAVAGGRNLTSTDNRAIEYTSNSSAINITIPTGLSIGFTTTIIQGNSGAAIVAGAGGTTIVGGVIGVATTANPGDKIEITCVATNTYVIKLISI